MLLHHLLENIAATNHYPHNLTIEGLALDSRAVKQNYLFIALAGAKQHGLTHLNQAINNGAMAVIYDANTIEMPTCSIPFIHIDKLNEKLGFIAARFYAYPSKTINVIGITGTNGKTSCSQFLAQSLNHCGIIGTLGWGQYGALNKTLNTTPDALAVQQMLAHLRDETNHYVAMEVSSHGLHQGRVNGVRFKGAVFTNISHDHLDYHQTMQAYIEAKCLLLQSPNLEFAVINLDDDYSEQLINALPSTVKLWGVSRKNKLSPFGETIQAFNSRHSNHGLSFQITWQGQTQTIQSPLYGDFNIDNVLSVLAVLLALNIPLHEIIQKLAQLKPVQGRMERFGGNHQPLIFVDYAHTPDALEKVLMSVRPHCKGNLWVVFGCGGNRDARKRPLMGAIAEKLADKIIITDDNPRDENSDDIVQAIISNWQACEKLQLISHREKAIQTAIQQANSQDCIVIAGKGHEDYQEIKGIKMPFSDAEIVLAQLIKQS